MEGDGCVYICIKQLSILWIIHLQYLQEAPWRYLDKANNWPASTGQCTKRNASSKPKPLNLPEPLELKIRESLSSMVVLRCRSSLWNFVPGSDDYLRASPFHEGKQRPAAGMLPGFEEAVERYGSFRNLGGTLGFL